LGKGDSNSASLKKWKKGEAIFPRYREGIKRGIANMNLKKKVCLFVEKLVKAREH